MNSLPQNNLLSIKEASKLLRVSTKTLRRWETSGRLIPVRTAGGHRRYTVTQIDDIKKPKPKEVFISPFPSKDQLTATIAEIAREEAKKEIINDKILGETINNKQRLTLREKQKTEDDTYNTLTNLYKFTLPSTRRIFAYYVLEIFLLVGIFAGFKNNIIGKGTAFLSSRNNRIAQIFGSVSTQTFNIYVETNISENVNIGKDLEISGGDLTSSSTIFNLLNENVETLNIGGAGTAISIGAGTGSTTINNNLNIDGTANDIAGTLNLSGNTLTSTADLLIDPGGGGVSIGTGTAGNIDLAGDDFFITGDLEVDGSAYLPTVVTGGDTITDFTGSGLSVSGGALQTTLGTAIETGEITDGTIAEVDLNISNSPIAGYILSYDSSTGGFAWLSAASDLWTDSGTITYLTSTTDDLAIGGTDSAAAYFFDVSEGDLSITGDLEIANQITAGSGSIAITTAVGYIDADAIGLISSDGTGLTSSASGLETDSDRLGLLQGCSNSQVLKWNNTTNTWDCGNDDGGTVGIINVESNDTTLYTGISTIDFSSNFTLNESPTGEVNISIADDILDFTEFADTMSLDASTEVNLGNYNYTIDLDGTGDFVLTDGGTTFASFDSDGAMAFTPQGTSDITFNVDGDSLFTLDSSVTNADILIISPFNVDSGSTNIGTLTTANLTDTRTWTLPDSSGTLATLSDITSGNYWQLGSEGLAPYNTTLDLFVGGTSTSGATFAVEAATGNVTLDGNLTSTASNFSIDAGGDITMKDNVTFD
ncbi:MAG: Virion structural protein, partial [Candidatus Woesebacteria bacterium GW2011_GWA1_38_8]